MNGARPWPPCHALVGNAGPGDQWDALKPAPHHKDKVAQYVIDQRWARYDTFEDIEEVYNFIVTFEGDGIVGVVWPTKLKQSMR